MNEPAQSSEIQQKACIICQKQFSGEVNVCPDDGIALTPLAIPHDPMIGTLFCDRFQILEVLGGGGMGMVYRAKHLMMQRSVAIKILHTKMIGNPDALKRFKVEAKAASNFSHPNILNIFDFGISNEGQPYMVMDFLDGLNLSALLENEGRVSSGRAVNMFLQTCSALAHAHAKEIIHRDVKPSNIMLVEFEGRKDFVKLVDFGIAKVLNPSIPEAENLTRTGEVFGSPLYMSPEQCKGQVLDVRADIYSFGAVMYRVVSGLPIFSTADALETMFKQVTEMPQPFAHACPDLVIPPKLEAIIFKCLEKDKVSRYQSMNELREELEMLSADYKQHRVAGLQVESALNATPSFLNVSLDDVVQPTIPDTIFNHTQTVRSDSASIQFDNKPSFLNDSFVQPPKYANAPFSEISSPTPELVESSLESGIHVNPLIATQQPAIFSTGSTQIDISHAEAAPEVSSVASAITSPSTVAPKVDDDTVSIVLNKKSLAIGGSLAAALLLVLGLFLAKPTSPGAVVVPKPDSHFASAPDLPLPAGVVTPPVRLPKETAVNTADVTRSANKAAVRTPALARPRIARRKPAVKPAYKTSLPSGINQARTSGKKKGLPPALKGLGRQLKGLFRHF